MMIPKKNKQTKGKSAKFGYSDPLVGPFHPLDDLWSYADQQGATLKLPGATTLLSISAGGGIAQTIQVSKNLIASFNTRLATTFNQYRILGVDMEIVPMSETVGACVFFWDEKSSAVPVAIDATERIVQIHPHSRAALAGRNYHMKWRAKDLVDLGYLETLASATFVANFKAYTDTANFGTPTAAVSNAWLIKPTLLVEFRGLIAA